MSTTDFGAFPAVTGGAYAAPATNEQAAVPDGPPFRLRRQQVMAAMGPERILPEWWRPEDVLAHPRDYYRVTLEDGQNLWVYREGLYGEAQYPRWRVQGRFA